jgi:CRP-like cAMP-binding protein
MRNAQQAEQQVEQLSGPRQRKRRTRSGRFTLLNSFVDVTLRELSGAEAKVWLVLFRDAQKDGTVRASQTDIARRSGLTVRAVKKAIRRLKSQGLIQVLRQGRLNVGPSQYRLRAIVKP